MKKTIRLLSLLLVICFLAGFLAACDNNNTPVTTTKKKTTTAGGNSDTIDPKWNDVDFSGKTLRVLINNDVPDLDAKAAGAQSCIEYLRGPDDNAKLSNRVYSAAQDRYDLVLETLGLSPADITYKETNRNGNCDNILPELQGLYMANDQTTPELIIHENYGMVRAGITGYLYNAKGNYGTTNYFDLTSDGWYLDLMEEDSLDKNKIYMLMGDYTIDQFRLSYAVLANIGIIDDAYHPEGDKDGMAALYDKVKSGEWDYDLMLEIGDAAYQDQGVTGLANDKDDIMGIVGDQSWSIRSLFATSGLDVFTRNAQGESFYIDNPSDPSNDIVTWLDKLLEMDRNKFCDTNWRGHTTESPYTTFTNGRTAFALNQMVVTLESKSVQDMTDGATLLPTPKYMADGMAQYKALVSDNASSAGILLSATKDEFSLASAFLQLITEQSDDFMNEYYEVNLKLKSNTASSTDHIKMLEYIHDGICAPLSFYYDNYCAKSLGQKTYGAMFYEISNNDSNTFTSDWASTYEAKANRWAQIKTTYGSQEK